MIAKTARRQLGGPHYLENAKFFSLLNGILQRFVHWPSENKEADLAGRWVYGDLSCLNEVMSPSPGELLFDASAQSPPSEKTVEM